MKVPNTPENNTNCLCPNCPTHNECMKDQKLFCSIGKTSCELKKQGCLCGECPVASEYQLHDLYFCEQGAAK
ncbi:MAG: DUF2769 domain-containing protein [Patescibacteria group bacterium]|nr:DUF2769 domain-containing protein [Patescibacteria group bacterium]